MAVPRPLIQNSVLSRVAGAVDAQRRKNGGASGASVADVLTLVAAIVCGGEKVLVDPTVPGETMERTEQAADVLELEFDLERPSDLEIAEAARHGGSNLTQMSAEEVKLVPVPSHGPYPPNGPELTSGHLDLARKVADHVGVSDGEGLARGDWMEMATWLCGSEHDRSWGNKLLAGLCSYDGEADGRGESVTAQYLADLQRIAPDWKATPEAYWMTNERVAKFRSGFLPSIANRMGGMYYGQSSGKDMRARVEFFDKLGERILTRRGDRVTDRSELADTAATRALAWAAVRPILDTSWNRTNPLGLIEAAKKHAGGDAAQLMKEGFRIECGEPIDEDLVERLSTDMDAFVNPYRTHIRGTVLLASSMLAVTGVIAYFSPYLAEHLRVVSGIDVHGAIALGDAAAGGAIHYGVGRLRRRHAKYDVSAAYLVSEFLEPKTREKVERKLSTELGITS